jgi:hypothetical protein
MNDYAARACEECGRTFTKSPKLSAAQWLSYRFCSKRCAMLARGRAALAALPDIETFFWSRVKKTTTCWLWQGSTAGGYGEFRYAKRRYRAHVFALKLDGRPVPKGKQGLHHCDTPSCVRPSHLYVGTPKMNTADALSRGRMPHGVRHWAAKLTPEAVLEMRWQRLQGVPIIHIGRTFGVTNYAARCAILGRTWKSVPSNADDLERLKQVCTVYARARWARLKATAEAPHRRYAQWEYPFDRREYLSLFPRVPPPAGHH